MIEVRNVACHFGALRAVDDCSFRIEPGRITGIVGPNGAGKSTVFNIIAGALKPSAGSVHLANENITGREPYELHAKGLLRTFQVAQEFHRMTVFENLLAAAPNPGGDSLLRAFLTPSSMRHREASNKERAEDILHFLHLDGVAGSLAGEISGGQKKLLELGRTLMVEAKVILLDEIAAGVNRVLLGHIEERIRALNRERGLTFCIIEHDMDFVARLCDHVIVMAEGRVLTEGTMEDVRRDERVVEAYFGGGRFHSAGADAIENTGSHAG